MSVIMLKGSAVAPMGNIVGPDVRNLKESAVAPKGNIVDPAEDPTWELFCLENNMHELAQDDEKSELAPSHRPLRGVALGLFTAMVTRIIPTSSSEAT